MKHLLSRCRIPPRRGVGAVLASTFFFAIAGLSSGCDGDPSPDSDAQDVIAADDTGDVEVEGDWEVFVDADGAGPTGPCGEVCDMPPAPSCSGPLTLVTHTAAGICVDDACYYEATTRACGFGCADGACLPDPCAGVTCENPPNGCYQAVGGCVAGDCVYIPDDGASCDDGDGCTTADMCRAGACVGTAKSCAAPPADVCADSDTLSVYAAAGACADGACTYDTTARTCAAGCDAGKCVGDPCGGVTCDSSPAPACADHVGLVTYAASGTCEAGTCSYVASETTCQHGCINDKCLPPVGLVIAEVRYDTTGVDGEDAFIEIHGPPFMKLQGVSLVVIAANGGNVYATIPLTGDSFVPLTDSIPNDGVFLMTHPDASADLLSNADHATPRVALRRGPLSLQLRYGDFVLDALAYGDFQGGAIAAGEGTPHPGHGRGMSLARDATDTDTGDNATDFHVVAPTPGVSVASCGDASAPCNTDCIAAGASCPVALPEEGCLADGDCDDSGSCVDQVCMCQEGTLPCLGGCCAWNINERHFKTFRGDVVDFAYGPDGTAYVALSEGAGIGSFPLTVQALAPGSDTWVEIEALESADYREGALTVRADGDVVLATLVDSETHVELRAWTPGESAARLYNLNVNESRSGLGLTIDEAQTCWIMTTPKSDSEQTLGTLSGTDVWNPRDTQFDGGLVNAEGLHLDTDPRDDTKYVFYQPSDGYPRTHLNRVYDLDAKEHLPPTRCGGEATAFDSNGALWGITTDGTVEGTAICRNAAITTGAQLSRQTVPSLAGFDGIQTGDFESQDVVVDGDGTAYAFFTRTFRQPGITTTSMKAWASRDGRRWNSFGFNGSSAVASSEFSTVALTVRAARRPNGKLSIVSLARENGNEGLTLIEFQ